jgi:pyruvate,orthophosphate dikinase
VIRSSWCATGFPLDTHALAAAAGVVTASGGPASHAAVVARAVGKPAVVGAGDLTVDIATHACELAGRTVREGTLVTIDGSGEVVVGSPRIVDSTTDSQLLDWADEVASDKSARDEAERLTAAHTVLLAG